MAAKLGVTRQEQKTQTRQALKRAAVSCIREHGFVATRIGDITRAAGVAQGTFYVHFPSKEALLDELLGEFNEGLVARLAPRWLERGGMEPAEAPDGSAPAQRIERTERIRRTAGAFLDYWAEHREFVEIYADRLASGLTVETLRDGINPQAAGMLGARLAALLGGRTLDPTAAQLAVHGLLALWARIGLQYLFAKEVEVDRETAVSTLVRLSRGALDGLLADDGEV
jgi:AcrR family transcriptional regulator